jgi:hypothetical protein
MALVASYVCPIPERSGSRIFSGGDAGYMLCVSKKPIMGDCYGQQHLPIFANSLPLAVQHDILTHAITAYDVGSIRVIPERIPTGSTEILQYVNRLFMIWRSAPLSLHQALVEYNVDTTDGPMPAYKLWDRIVSRFPSLVRNEFLTCVDMMRWYTLAILPEYGNPVDVLQVDEGPDEVRLPPTRDLNIIQYAKLRVEEAMKTQTIP